jgi:hypothetical protein
LPTLSGEREQSGSAMMSLLEILKQLSIPMLVLAILTIRRKSLYSLRKETIFFFLIALSGTLPFFFMDRQHHYYFMPAMVFWMLGFAMLFEQNDWPWTIQRKRWVKRLTIANLSLWVVAIGLSLYYSKSPSRDKHTIKALTEISKLYPQSHIQVNQLELQWKLSAIGARYNKLYFSNAEQSLYLTQSEENAPEGFELVEEFEKAKLKLYKKATP